LLENIVFIELLRRGCELFYFSGKYECDFLVKDNLKIKEAIQVTYALNNENYNSLREDDNPGLMLIKFEYFS
jgi:predicted AAA+ superfamily ATPase